MEKLIHKLTYTFTAIFVVVLFIIFSFVGGGVGTAYAATSTMVNSFDKTEVLDDLETATIDGKKFSPVNYPYDSTGVFKHPEIFTVVEYCYSYRSAQRENYALYIYFYNPQALDISTTSKANKITMGVKYGTDKDGNVKVEDYEKFDLQFCSKSIGDYKDLFYKFKVIDHVSEDGKTIAQRVNSVERRYDISEIELLTVGDINATAYGVGGTFKFTGYAKGYGADTEAESTLANSRADLETIKLDLTGVKDGIDKRTYWRSNSSNLGAHHQNQINSVFFAIDTNVLEKFGYTLQKIKAEWWEYKTAPAIVIDNKGIYDRLAVYSGIKISEDYDRNRGLTLHNSDYFYSGGIGGSVSFYQYTWNEQLAPSGIGGTHVYSSEYIDTLLSLLFYTGGISVDDYTLLPETLQQYFETYNKSYVNGHLTFNAHDYSADLFTDSVDAGRTHGYNLREFDISNPNDYWNIHSYDDTHSWWDKLWDYGFGSITTDDTFLDIAPIQMVTPQDMAVTDLATHLKINPADVGNFRKYYNSVKSKCEVIIFRYAMTDYWAEDLHVYDIMNNENFPYNNMGKHNPHVGEVRQGTQFFDFDILTMTFNKKGALTTLGCVSSPVDHWTGYTPSVEPEYPDIWKILKIMLGIIIGIVIFVICVPVLAPILGVAFKTILWIISAPFKSIGKLFKKKE